MVSQTSNDNKPNFAGSYRNDSVYIFGNQSDLTINCSGDTKEKTDPRKSNAINSDSSANQNAHQHSGKNNPIFVFGRQPELPINCSGNATIETVSQTPNNKNSDSSVNQNANQDNGKSTPIFVFGRQSNLPISCSGNNTVKSEPQTSIGKNSDSSVNQNTHQDSKKSIPIFVFGKQSDLPISCSSNSTVKTEPQTSIGKNSHAPVNQNAHQYSGKNNPIFVFGRQPELPINCSGNATIETVSQTPNNNNSDSSVNQNANQDNGKSMPIFVFGRQSDLPISCSSNNTVKTEPQTSIGKNLDSSVNQNTHQDSRKSIPMFVFGRQSDLPINCSGNNTVKTEPQTSIGKSSDSSVNQNTHQDSRKSIPIFVFGNQSDLPISCSSNSTIKIEPQTSIGKNSDSSVDQNENQDNCKSIPIFIFGGQSDSPINFSDDTTLKTVTHTSDGVKSDSPVNHTYCNDNNPATVLGAKIDLSLFRDSNYTGKKVSQTSNGLSTRLHSTRHSNGLSGNTLGINTSIVSETSNTRKLDSSIKNTIGTQPESAISTDHNIKGKIQGNMVPQTSSDHTFNSSVQSNVPNVNNDDETVFEDFGIKLDLQDKNSDALSGSNKTKGNIPTRTSSVMQLAKDKTIAGIKHFQNERYEESLAMYDEAVKLCPKNPGYLCKRSEALFMLERYKEALKDAQKATELDPTFPDGYISKAKCCLILGKLTIGEKAARCASELGVQVNQMQSDIETCNEKYKAGLWAIKSNYYKMAISKMDDCLILSPGCFKFKLRKAECLAMVGRYSEAERIALTRLKLKDSDPIANYVLGLCYYFQEEYDQAFDIFKMLIDDFNDTKAMEIYEKAKQLKEKKDKGNQAYTSEKWQSALDFYNEALAIDQFHTRVNSKLHYNKAAVYIKTDKIEEAVQALTAALKLDNVYSKAFLKRAHCYTQLGKYREAVKDYESLYEIDKSTENRRLLQKAKTLSTNIESAEEMKNRGNEYFKREDFAKALKMYDEAVRLCPASHIYLSNRAATYMQLERYREALADSKKAVDLNATFTKGYIRIAKCSVIFGELALGEHAIRRATELGGGDSVKNELNIIKNLRILQMEAQNAMKDELYQRAIDVIDRYLVDSSRCSEMQLLKAECLAMLGSCREAEDLTLSVDDNANKNYVLGLCRYFDENYDMAIELLKLAPDYTKAMNLLKKAKQLQDKWARGHDALLSQNWLAAILAYNEGLSIDKNHRNVNSKMYCRKAVAYKNLNQLRDAIQAFTSALELNKTYVAAYRDRADCYMQLHEYEKAVPDYEALCMYEESKHNIQLMEEATHKLKLKRKDYHYWVLGVATTASQSDIATAYRKSTLIDHPDRHLNASPAEKRGHARRFLIKKTACDILSDPHEKALYDRTINRY